MTSPLTTPLSAVEAMARAPIPIPKGGLRTNEDEARWLEQTLIMRMGGVLAGLRINATLQPTGLYELLLLSLEAASKRGAGALCALYPGVAEVIAGSAVVVPMEPTGAMIWAGGGAVSGHVAVCTDEETAAGIFEVMLAAAPYAPPAPAAEGDG